MLNPLLCLGLCFGAPNPYATVDAAAVEVLVDDHLNGSGFIVGPEGTVATAAHVVPDKSRRIEVRSRTLGRMRVGVRAVDRGSDLALLRLPPRETPYPALSLAQSDPYPTQQGWLFGTPIYRHRVLLGGTVARSEPTYEYLPDKQLYLRVFHVSAPSPPGTSGGAWVNNQGEIIGLQSGLMHDSGAPVGIAYIVPVDAIRALLASGKDADTATLGIGVEELWEQGADTLSKYPPKTEGLYVAKARDDGPAARAGVEVGVVITHLDGKPIALRDTLIERVRAKKPGDTVRVRIWPADGKAHDVEVKLARLESLR